MSRSTLEERLKSLVDAEGLAPPVEEYRFHPTRKWRFDFYWPEFNFACECEGAVWVGGRHTRPQGFIKDAEKYNEAALMGIKVIRVTDKHIKDGSAINWIRRAHGCEHIPISK